MASGFVLGALCAKEATKAWGFGALVISTVFYFLIGISGIAFVALNNHITFFQAATGNWSSWRELIDRFHHLKSSYLGRQQNTVDLVALFDEINKDGEEEIVAEVMFHAFAHKGATLDSHGLKILLLMQKDKIKSGISIAELVTAVESYNINRNDSVAQSTDSSKSYNL